MTWKIIFSATCFLLPVGAFAAGDWLKVDASRVECQISTSPEDGAVLNITVDGKSYVEVREGRGIMRLDIGAYVTTCQASVHKAREDRNAVFIKVSQRGRGMMKPEAGFAQQ